MCCRKMSHTPEPKSGSSSAAATTPPPQTVRGFRGAGVSGGEGRRGPNACGPTPAAPLTDALGVMCRGVVAPVSGESGDSAAGGSAIQRSGAEGRGHGRDRGGRAKGGQAAARGEGTETEAAEAGGKGGERGEPEAVRPRADPFNLAESDRLGGSMVADILVVSQEEG